MGKRTLQSDWFKLILSFIWFAFTFSMVTWWWIFSLRQLQDLATSAPGAKYERLRWMMLLEGPILLGFIFCGGAALLIFSNRERMRNLRLRLFFSNFSHDLKTSLSRIRLRTEVLAQKHHGVDLQNLMDEVSRLDLQLENSLWVARGEEQNLFSQQLKISDLIGQLRIEWSDMEIHLQRNAMVIADPAALKSVIRNILQNSWVHGQASRINISVKALNPSKLKLIFKDNGKGYTGNVKQLGLSTLPAVEQGRNGIGLYLTKFLMERMKGEIKFENSSEGFSAVVMIPGVIL